MLEAEKADSSPEPPSLAAKVCLCAAVEEKQTRADKSERMDWCIRCTSVQLYCEVPNHCCWSSHVFVVGGIERHRGAIRSL